ncbi:MAG: hypothetical protein P1R58_11000 [bacterium]|nr:hypothetical protein [bacterium]
MGTNHKLINSADKLIEKLSETDLSVLNLDDLTAWMKSARQKLVELETARTETALLRQDYIERISGMAKAIAAVRQSHELSQETLEFIQQLPNMSASDLIANYRKLSARFRDSFPTSFGGPNKGAARARNRQLGDYK